MASPTIQFTVKAQDEFTAYIYRDHRAERNEIVVGFAPYLSRLEHEEQTKVSETEIRRQARKIALQLAAAISGISADDLKIDKHEGVSAMTVVPKDGYYPEYKLIPE